MTGAVLLLSLLAAQVEESEPPPTASVLLMDLSTTTVEAPFARSIGGVLASSLSRYEQLDVLSNEDVRRAIALEGEKQSVGCESDASCLAEVAQAMGAELALFGDVEKIEGRYVLNLNLLDVTAVKSQGRVSVQGRNFDELSAAASAGLRELLAPTSPARGWSLPVEDDAGPAPPASTLPLWLLGGGGVAAVAGALATVVGVVPWALYADARGRALDAEGDAKGATVDGASSALADARRAHADAARAAAMWTWGLPLAVTGGVVLAGGLVAAATGGALLALEAE